jgi:CDK inhibitor PHO81
LPISYYSSNEFSTVQLKTTIKPKGDIIFLTNLPLKEELTILTCRVESLEGLYIEFDLFPAFGTKCLGRASLPPSILCNISQSENNQPMEYFVSLFDTQMRVIGELAFRLSIIKPFTHHSLLIGGKVETYWKATTVVSTSNYETSSGNSLVTSSSLAKEFIELPVQFTKDGRVVVYHDWLAEINGIKLPISNFELADLQKYLNLVNLEHLNSIMPSTELVNYFTGKLLTLEDALKVSFN